MALYGMFPTVGQQWNDGRRQRPEDTSRVGVKFASKRMRRRVDDRVAVAAGIAQWEARRERRAVAGQ